MEYTLDLGISNEDLVNLKAAGMNITLAKPVGGSAPNVNWLVFDPFPGNTVTWEEKFGLYASPLTQYVNGAKISRLSQLPPSVLDGKSYLFDNSNTFSKYDDINPPEMGSFKVLNEKSEAAFPMLTFGLTQPATVRGGVVEPTFLNAALVVSHMDAIFTPITTVYVWLQNQYTSGTVITSIQSKATKVTYQGSTVKQALVYDRTKGMFVEDNAKSDESGNKIEYIIPQGLY